MPPQRSETRLLWEAQRVPPPPWIMTQMTTNEGGKQLTLATTPCPYKLEHVTSGKGQELILASNVLADGKGNSRLAPV